MIKLTAIICLFLIVKTVQCKELFSELMPTLQEKKGSTRFYKQNFPIVLPPYYNENGEIQLLYKPDRWGSCLFYSEGINIIVYSKKSKIGQYATATIRAEDALWEFHEDDVKCSNSPVGNYTFTVRINTIKEIYGFNGKKPTPIMSIEPQDISFTIKIKGDNLGYWKLIDAFTRNLTITSKSSTFLDKDLKLAEGTRKKLLDYVGLNSVHGWAWGCHSSQALFFPVAGDFNENYLIGISFYNTQIQPFNVVNNETDQHGHPLHSVQFTLNMEDCTGTFSVGSWMGIITGTVLLASLLFGYLMLNSIKSHDRFDHPKQKQIVVNLRE